MKILASGCSFTAGTQSWPYFVNEHAEVTNLAMPAAGNRYISQSCQVELINQPDCYDLVLVMWSGLTRHDVTVSEDVYNRAHRSKTTVHGANYIFMGDMMSRTDPVVKDYQKKHFQLTDNEAHGCQSLIDMIALQSFLKLKKINYRFMSYINYWNTNSEVHNLNFGLYRYPSCTKLAQEIDFNNFLFYNKNNDGLYEFAKEHDWTDQQHRFHPTLEGHQAWGNWIAQQL